MKDIRIGKRGLVIDPFYIISILGGTVLFFVLEDKREDVLVFLAVCVIMCVGDIVYTYWKEKCDETEC